MNMRRLVMLLGAAGALVLGSLIAIGHSAVGASVVADASAGTRVEMLVLPPSQSASPSVEPSASPTTPPTETAAPSATPIPAGSGGALPTTGARGGPFYVSLFAGAGAVLLGAILLRLVVVRRRVWRD